MTPQCEPQAAVRLTADLVRFNTTNPPGNEAPAIDFLAARFRAAGFETAVVPYPEGPNRAHVVARLRGSARRRGLLFSGHVDVVPPGQVEWTVPPFGAEQRDSRLYGRGACDMKAGVAALVVAAESFARARAPLEGDLVVAVTADEERNCLGADHLVEQPLFDGLGSVIVAEPTGLALTLAEKGALWVEALFLGKTAHGSMPHLGANAVSAASAFLVRWEEYFASLQAEHPLLGRPTLNAGGIEGGVKINVVPDRCLLQLDMRTVPPLDHSDIVSELWRVGREVAAGRLGIRFEAAVLSDRPPVSCSADTPLARRLATAVADLAGVDAAPRGVPYCTEACVWAPRLGLDVAICGPGNAGMAHQPDEYVELDEIRKAALVYTRVAAEMLLP